MVADNNPPAALLPHLAVCVTFFYDAARLAYLREITSHYSEFSEKVDIYVITNRDDPDVTELIRAALPGNLPKVTVKFIVPRWLGHPYLLTWVHREVFREVVKDPGISHFLYTEDDLRITAGNVAYWLHYRPILREHGLIPSFFRVEKHPRIGWCSTDCKVPVCISSQPVVPIDRDRHFICLPNPYQGTYFLDRELMDEFAASPAMSPDFGRWKIRESAAAGLTFVNVPAGFTSRNVVPFYPARKLVCEDSWIRHLPGNYANNPELKFGKLPVEVPGLLLTRLGYLRWRWGKSSGRVAEE